MPAHVVNNILDSYVGRFFYYPFVYISDDTLDHSKLLKQLPASIQNFLGEHVLLPIDPKVRETFLSRIEDLG